MKNNIKVIVNGKPYEIEIDNINASPMTVLVNGQAYEVTLDSRTGSVCPRSIGDTCQTGCGCTGASSEKRCASAVWIGGQHDCPYAGCDHGYCGETRG